MCNLRRSPNLRPPELSFNYGRPITGACSRGGAGKTFRRRYQLSTHWPPPKTCTSLGVKNKIIETIFINFSKNYCIFLQVVLTLIRRKLSRLPAKKFELVWMKLKMLQHLQFYLFTLSCLPICNPKFSIVHLMAAERYFFKQNAK